MANPAARFVITATDKTKKAFNSVKRSLKGIRKSFSLAKAAAIGFTGYLTGRMLKSVAGLSDGWKQLSAQINLVTTSEEQSNRVREELLAISQRTRTDLSANANLYAKMARATKSLGVSEKDLLEITETIGKAMQISGASTVETTQSLRQLGQALASGVLRGDEFNSMMEGSPRLMQAVADSLGVTIGALREMAANGELTAKKLIEAFKGQGQKIAEEFKVLPKTFGDVFTVIKNDILAFVGAADEAEGASASIVAQMTKHWDSLR
ncbi:MAG: tape measure protein, partial [bacterium]|nr:tape measure protein [bacterium]